MSPLVEAAHTFILTFLKPCETYPFHNLSHTLDVWERSREIGKKEWLEGETLENLEIAALFHDAGFTKQYSNNEFLWAEIARDWLIEQGCNEEKIEIIIHIIMATVLFSPTNSLQEQIIQDADLDNLGRKDSFERSAKYLEELQTIGKKDISPESYWLFTLSLIMNFHFHTNTSKRKREKQRQKNISLIEAYIVSQNWKLPKKILDEISKI